MTRKRVTKEEKQQRVEWAMKQIDKGVGLSELASLISETWECKRRNARHVVFLAHKEFIKGALILQRQAQENYDRGDWVSLCV